MIDPKTEGLDNRGGDFNWDKVLGFDYGDEEVEVENPIELIEEEK